MSRYFIPDYAYCHRIHEYKSYIPHEPWEMSLRIFHAIIHNRCLYVHLLANDHRINSVPISESNIQHYRNLI